MLQGDSMVTPFTLEFAFEFLGDVCGKTIVDLGRGDGISKVALASQGANVISVDITQHQKIPIDDAGAHGVLCNSILRHGDAVAIARQIRRVLKPGGVAVFREPEAEPLSLEQVGAVSRAVGRPGRSQLGLILRVVDRAGASDLRVVRLAQQFDNWVLERFPVLRGLAAPLVWEARKES
ncbi:MAG: hypothetical protein HY646_22760 [Acidobacteria bacterium]|nr:hypothetical protein [Acidobacteriota bacterium]